MFASLLRAQIAPTALTAATRSAPANFPCLLPCCRSEDDLTHQLGEIIKANNRLRKQEESGAPQHIISEFALLLQMHITGYIDNSLPGLPQAKQRSGRPIKSICQRLKGERAGWLARGSGMGEEVQPPCCRRHLYASGLPVPQHRIL
jgi:hypothetical protein